MNLSASTLSELIRSLRSNPVSGPEKRKDPRVGLRAKAEIVRLAEPDVPAPIWVRDISAGGMNFVVAFSMPQGEVFKLALGKDETMSCSVMHCRRMAPKVFAIGAKFDDPPVKRRQPSAGK